MKPSGQLSPSPLRAWALRAALAVGAPVAVLLALEVGLRVVGFGQSSRFMVPDGPGRLRTNPEFVGSFLPSAFDLRPLNQGIAMPKPAGTLRVVVLGESAAQGVPVPAFGMAAQLRQQLRSRFPGTRVEVINTGIVAINSHVVRRIALEMEDYAPDLFVVYMGNNEVIGPYGPGCTYLSSMPPLWMIRASLAVRASRTGQLVARLAALLGPRQGEPQEWGGMAMFARSFVRGDDPRLAAVEANFEANLRDIVRSARGSGIPVVLCTPVSNLKDCAPLLSMHPPGFGDADGQWRALEDRGVTEYFLGERDAAYGDLSQALQRDPAYADTSYFLGRLDLAQGRTDQARRRLLDAQHWDALRFRPDAPITDAVRRVAAESGAGCVLVDAARRMGSDAGATGPIPGRDVLFEHVHFAWNGNAQLAGWIGEAAEKALGREGKGRWLSPAECARTLAYTEHEELGVLQKVSQIVDNPPFTGQAVYPVDQALLARAMEAARTLSREPRVLQAALAAVREARQRDGENPDLAKIEEAIDEDLGDIAGALDCAHAARSGQPVNFALAADEAIKLSRLGRWEPARQLLEAEDRRARPRDRVILAPAFADYYMRRGDFAGGVSYLDAVRGQSPDSAELRIIRARLLVGSGDLAGAESELRAVRASHPGNAQALEELVKLLVGQGRTGEAEEEAVRALAEQPGNATNNLRAAVLFDKKHDSDRELRALLAAEASGPVSAPVLLKAGSLLEAAGRYPEALRQFALARVVAQIEGSEPAVRAAGMAIERVRPKGL
jgi:tetratricopeptide (TPR) repeat protein